MSVQLSSAARQRIKLLGEFLDRVHRLHGLVEQYATATQNAQLFEMPIRRGFEQLKLGLTGVGLDAMAQLCGSMVMAMRRGGSPQNRARILREGVGSLRFQLELEQRAVASDDLSRQQKHAEGAEAQGE
ncbi:MAG TPA: hypothetical protein VK939_15835 [Longimicrobiales bacterium]|nr:hypothetical protein [Longimicrobiales bacterium]